MGKLKDWKIKAVLGVPLAFSILLLLITIYGAFRGQLWQWVGLLWLVKLLTDYIYLKVLAPFFNQKIPWVTYLICALIYPLYLSLMLILSIFKHNYEWKGRIIP